METTPLSIQYNDLEIGFAIQSKSLRIIIDSIVEEEIITLNDANFKFDLALHMGSEVLLRHGNEIIFEFEEGLYGVYQDQEKGILFFEYGKLWNYLYKVIS